MYLFFYLEVRGAEKTVRAEPRNRGPAQTMGQAKKYWLIEMFKVIQASSLLDSDMFEGVMLSMDINGVRMFGKP